MEASVKNDIGIKINKASQLLIRDNEIFRSDVNGIADLSTDEISGIKVTAATDNTFCCNNVHDINYGVLFEKDCGDTGLYGTNFSNHHHGLFLRDNTEIGVQSHTGNCWEGEYAGSAAIFLEDNEFDVLLSQFLIRPNTQPNQNYCLMPPSIQTTNDNWFTVDFTASTHNCSTDTNCDGLEEGRKKFSPRDSLLALGEILFDNDAIHWETTRRLYRKIEAQLDDLDIAANLHYLNFYNNQSTTTVGQFAQIEKEIADILSFDEANQIILNTNYQQLNTLIDNISAADVLLLTSTGADSVQLEQEKKLLYKDLYLLNTAHQQWFTTVLAQRTLDAESVLIENAAIMTATIYEENEQTVNDLYLRSLKQDFIGFSAEQIDQWDAIAWQCPEEGGYAIYRARAFMSDLTNELNFNETCGDIGFRNEDSTKDKDATIDFSLYPNPATDVLYIRLNENVNTIVKVQILDIYGRIVQSITKGQINQTLKLNTSLLTNGVYLLNVQLTTGKILNQSFIVSK